VYDTVDDFVGTDDDGRGWFGGHEHPYAVARLFDPPDVPSSTRRTPPMSDTALRAGLIRLAHKRPDLRAQILPLVTDRVAMEFETQEALDKYLKDHPRADKSKHKVKSEGAGEGGADKEKGKGKGKGKKDIQFEVDDATLEKRRPAISDDLKEYGSDAGPDDLKPEHREAIKGYNLEIVGQDAAQAVEIARKIKEGIDKSADICKMNPSVCEGNKGLTRDKMPQIEGEKTVKQMLEAVKNDGSPDEESRAKGRAMVQAGADPDSDKTVMQQMIDHFTSHGVQTKRTKVPVGMLKATQSEIKAQKTYSMANNYLKGDFDKIGDSVVVSRDGHILDGHHRWAALLTVDPSREMNVQVIDMDMDDLLAESQSVPGVYKADFAGTPLPEDDQKTYKSQAKTKFKPKGKGKKKAGIDEQAAYNARIDADRIRLETEVVRLAHANPTLRPRLASVLREIHIDRAVRNVIRG